MLPSIRALQRDPLAKRLPLLEWQLLLGRVMQLSRTQLLTCDERILTEAQWVQLQDWVARREAGEPIAYLLGEREFYGLPLRVTPDVLIPRPETELLVDTALAHLADLPPGTRVLDLGTGSGAIALALAHTRPDVAVWALDACEAALTVARANGQRLGLAVQWLISDWYAALPADLQFAVIVSNPPYIHRDDHHLQQGDLRFEPRSALTDHADGLTAIRRIVAGAPARLLPGGSVWLEHGWDQAPAVRALLQAHGFTEVCSLPDLAGILRVSGGRLPAGDDVSGRSG